MAVSQILRRPVKKLVTVRTLLPVYYDMAMARISRTIARILSSPTRKLSAVVSSLLTAATLATLGVYLWAGAAALPAALVVGPVLRRRLMRRLRVRRAALVDFPHGPLPSAREALLRLQIEPAAVDRILSRQDVAEEVLIAEFDQENRVLSHIGLIPALASSLVEREQFVPRRRHQIELVVVSDTLAVKKVHRYFGTFANELLALRALADVPGVPKVIGVRRRGRVLYQSFLPGTNLGSALAAKGISVPLQHSLASKYPSDGKWRDRIGASKERSQAVTAVRAILDKPSLDRLGNLFTAVHNAGVAIRDVKYGNVILSDGTPSLCDFDGAEVFSSNTRRFVRERQRDREKFNYLFGDNLLTERTLREQVRALARKRSKPLYAPVYYGHGYRVGELGSIELGSGKWLFVRRVLPDLRGKSVLDLGCNNALLPLEMLRAGAARVTAFEINPSLASFARMNHEWFEFVDNRRYDFELIDGSMNQLCDQDITGYDVATAFCSLYYETPENMSRIASALSRAVPVFVVQCNENPAEHSGELLERSSRPYLQNLLALHGFPHQETFSRFYYDRPLIIARCSGPTD